MEVASLQQCFVCPPLYGSLMAVLPPYKIHSANPNNLFSTYIEFSLTVYGQLQQITVPIDLAGKDSLKGSSENIQAVGGGFTNPPALTLCSYSTQIAGDTQYTNLKTKQSVDI